ncbi:uncharacterized protein LOC100883097 [Megachile rotundata]|uniref:uncharacterized protein LOC100883097 n=1 Tax=Megachile rotundata TaxID=143995 RepID=UPI000258DC36|nr:PREDICTED: suppressor protein SRP40-like [Megachile rotundata]
MVESDQSDKEIENEMPSLEVSGNTINDNETGQKRLREDTSDDESLPLPSKKICTSVDEAMPEKHEDKHISEANGIIENVKENADSINTENEGKKNKFMSEENTSESMEETNNTKSETESKEITTNNDSAIKQESDSQIKSDTDTKQEDIISTTSETNIDTKNSLTKEEEEEDGIKKQKKHSKSSVGDAEVVEGLELSVECASDKDSSSSSESENEKDKKPAAKTIIVKAKPNDSELDASSSDTEKPSPESASQNKSKKSTKKGKKRSRTSFSKAKSTDSEDNENSDEDYSPKSKKKSVANKKIAKSPSESKRGRGRAKKTTKKAAETDEEDENLSVTEDTKAEENISDVELTESENESLGDDVSKDDKGKKRSNKPEDDRRIQVLKKYIRTAGIHVKCYNDLWAGCKSNAARVRCLKQLLAEHGVNGRPTLEKCKKVKEKKERLKDIAELNTSNIISEGRITRAQRNKDSNKGSPKALETPTKQRETRNTYKRVLNVIDSDSE